MTALEIAQAAAAASYIKATARQFGINNPGFVFTQTQLRDALRAYVPDAEAHEIEAMARIHEAEIGIKMFMGEAV